MDEAKLPSLRRNESPAFDPRSAHPMLQRGVDRIEQIDSVPVVFDSMTGYDQSIYLWKGSSSLTTSRGNTDCFSMYEFDLDGHFKRRLDLPLPSLEKWNGYRYGVVAVYVRPTAIVVTGWIYHVTFTRGTVSFQHLYSLDGLLKAASIGWEPNSKVLREIVADRYHAVLHGVVSGVTSDVLWVRRQTDSGVSIVSLDYHFSELAAPIHLDDEADLSGSDQFLRELDEFWSAIRDSPRCDPRSYWECHYFNCRLYLSLITKGSGLQQRVELGKDIPIDTSCLAADEELQFHFPQDEFGFPGPKWRVWGNDVCFMADVIRAGDRGIIPTGNLALSHYSLSSVGLVGKTHFRLEGLTGPKRFGRGIPFLMDGKLYSFAQIQSDDDDLARSTDEPRILIHDLSGVLLNSFETRVPRSQNLGGHA